MTSDLKSAASRANGAKSHGPKTAEGREKSSRNSLTHGFTSKKTIVLKCENEGEFQTMLGYYADTYQPGGPPRVPTLMDLDNPDNLLRDAAWRTYIGQHLGSQTLSQQRTEYYARRVHLYVAIWFWDGLDPGVMCRSASSIRGGCGGCLPTFRLNFLHLFGGGDQETTYLIGRQL